MEHIDFTNLSPVQAQIALSLASGASISSSAQFAAISRTTIYSWLQNEPDFATAVQQATADYVLTLRDQLRDASAKALATITSLLDDLTAPASVRLKAALAILTRPQFPNQGWLLPEKIGNPNQEAFLENMACLEASARRQKLADTIQNEPHITENESGSDTSEHNFENSQRPQSPASNAAARTKSDTSEHQNAVFQPAQPIRVEKTGRNEPCPCGSGRKFKRCCLNHPEKSLAA